MHAPASSKPVKSLFGSLPSTERHSAGGDGSPVKRAGAAGGSQPPPAHRSPAKAAFKFPSPASRPSVAARQLGPGTVGSPAKHETRSPLRPASARASYASPLQERAGGDSAWAGADGSGGGGDTKALFAAHQAHALQEENRRFRAELYLLRGKADALTVRDPPAFHGARPVHHIISMIKWIRTSRLSIMLSCGLSEDPPQLLVGGSSEVATFRG